MFGIFTERSIVCFPAESNKKYVLILLAIGISSCSKKWIWYKQHEALTILPGYWFHHNSLVIFTFKSIASVLLFLEMSSNGCAPKLCISVTSELLDAHLNFFSPLSILTIEVLTWALPSHALTLPDIKCKMVLASISNAWLMFFFSQSFGCSSLDWSVKLSLPCLKYFTYRDQAKMHKNNINKPYKVLHASENFKV